jgi:uncharacterized protein (TIGR02246 family)
MPVKPEEVAKAYFNAVRTKDLDAFGELFAEDAVFVFPDGKDYVGLPAIIEMERAAFANTGPSPTPRVMILGDKAVAGEADVELADGRVIQAANLFYLNDEGKIQRLSSFTKWL